MTEGGVGVLARLGAGRSCELGMRRVSCARCGGRDDFLSSRCGGGQGCFGISSFLFSRRGRAGSGSYLIFLLLFLSRVGAAGIRALAVPKKERKKEQNIIIHPKHGVL